MDLIVSFTDLASAFDIHGLSVTRFIQSISKR